MIPLTAEEAGRTIGVGPLACPVDGISIDSRSIRPGDLFVALRGERFDGHDFVEAALAAGASGAIVERKTWADRREAEGFSLPRADGRPVYEVDDALETLGALARQVRRKSGATLIAVTGSVGKTSTKEILSAMVRRVLRVVATHANQNNEIGVPLTLLAAEPDTEVIIAEMGMRGFGEIAALARVAEPNVGVITNVYPVHLESLGTVKGVAEAKAELIAGIVPGGVAVVPCGNTLLKPYAAAASCRIVCFGSGVENKGADVWGGLEDRGEGDGYVVSVVWPEGQVEVETGYLPRHSLENVVAAAAACYAAGLPLGACVAGLRDARVSSNRGGMQRLAGLCVIDDTYNANPAGVRAALEDLVRVAGEAGGRPVAVLGDMLELGPESEKYHEEAGAYAGSIGVRALWGVGPRARSMVEGFRKHWEAKSEWEGAWTAGHVGSTEETNSVVAGLLPGDVVLFKASRSMKLESLVHRVVAQAEEGRWMSGGASPVGSGDATQETRRCSN